jgi:hypothetical protein
MTVLTEENIQEGPATCVLVEFESTRINRVVKSTMAAESAALSKTLDRQLYVRLLVESLLYGEPELGEDWRYKLKIPGVLVTDARPLYDHLNKTGSMPTERQTLIDLLITRDLVEAGCLKIRWVPTTHQVADILTKAMKPPPVCARLLREQKYSLVPTESDDEMEQHRKSLRQGQRERRKTRLKEVISKSVTVKKTKGTVP